MQHKISENSLETNLFRNSLIVCIVAASLLLLHDLLLDFTVSDMILEIIGIAFAGLFLKLSKKTDEVEHQIPVFLGVLNILLVMAWYINKGLGVGLVLDFLVVHIISIVLLSVRYRNKYLVLFTLMMAILFTVEFVNKDFYYISMQYRMAPVLSKTIMISITYIITTWVVLYLKIQYSQTIQVIMSQNFEINQKNETISNHNSNLEETVIKRTQDISDQKEKLLQYAFFNSHKVRAPLANILGAVSIIEESFEDLDLDERDLMLNIIKKESERLDSEVRSVQDIIHQTSDSFISEFINSSSDEK